MKAIYLEWEDSASVSGNHIWKDRDDGRTVICKTAGFVIREDKRTVTVAAHIAPDGLMSGDITVPKSCILKRRVVGWKK